MYMFMYTYTCKLTHTHAHTHAHAHCREATADGYHFNEFGNPEGMYRGNAVSRAVAHMVLNHACNSPQDGHHVDLDEGFV